MKKLSNNRGIALFMSLFVVTILIAVGAAFINSVVSEKSIMSREIDAHQAFYMADGGAQAGLKELSQFINSDLQDEINALNPQTVINLADGYVAGSDGLSLLLNYVQDSQNQMIFTQNGTELEYQGAAVAANGNSFRYKIYISEKSDPALVNGESWDFPYYYRIESTGTADGLNKKVVLSGDFTVRVQKGTFARYALFTNHHTTQSGGYVWFTDNTHFDGPLHTNERYSFAFNPGSVFDGAVSQEYTYARFYNNGWAVLLADDHNGTRDVPTFNSSFERAVDEIPLTTSGQQSDMQDQATASGTYSSNGIYLPNSSGSLTGGIYVKGDSTISLNVSSGNPVYTITQGSTTKTITVDQTNNQTIVDDGSTQTIYSSLPDGVDDLGTIIYVDGDIDSLGGTVEQDEQVTIVAADDVVIQNDLVYENYTAAVGMPGTSGYTAPSASGTDNLLGVVAWNGDVRIGTSAPDNVQIHSTLLAPNGVFTVDSYGSYSIGPRGTATLLGGAITDYYGAFGKFSGSTGNQLSGYGRNFVYDTRMQVDSSPPYYPTLSTFIAFTNDITDKVTWQEGE